MMTHKTNVVFHIVPERERGTNENVILSLQHLKKMCRIFFKPPWVLMISHAKKYIFIAEPQCVMTFDIAQNFSQSRGKVKTRCLLRTQSGIPLIRSEIQG